MSEHTMKHHRQAMAGYTARHFRWEVSSDHKVATITLNRPERKNPLTFDSYAELRDLFRGLVYATDIKTVVVTGAGGNFCSGGTCTRSSGRSRACACRSCWTSPG
ncbi:enoyl-CoA hydratase [Bordetella trematum]|nr:enoyl-CoA hydratase [Bordetella trematum]